MKMMFKAVAKKLFGAKYEGLKKTMLVWLVVFWGIRIAGLQIQITPFILYLMVSTFTAGVMWQALSSEDNAANMKNLFMMPFEPQKLIFSYTAALGIYTLLTKTAGLMAVVLAVFLWSGRELLGSILCTVNAILMTACIYSQKKYRSMGFVWTGACIAVIFLLWDSVIFLPAVTGSIVLAVLVLSGADAYSFYHTGNRSRKAARSSGHYSVWRYLFRYLTAHKNYLLNTVIMWGVGCVLPVFLGQMDSVSVMPVGFAILSLNTPLCILLSCDPALEQAVRFLPGQKRAFCIPYCLFIFLCNMTADVVFLCSWQIRIGGVTGTVIVTAVIFALQSAIGSVLLEWLCPIRGWKTESDLWHHPRKYIVPAIMLLIAGVVGTMPVRTAVLTILLGIESIVLLFGCRRC